MILQVVKTIIPFLIGTLLIEGGLAWILKVRGRDFGIVLLTNIATNPIVQIIGFMLNINVPKNMVTPIFILVEVATVFIEGVVYMKTLEKKPFNPLLMSFILNAASYGTGVLINMRG